MEREVRGQLKVNGETVRVVGPAHGSLLDTLRGPLGLTGAKRGCDIGRCGSCTVLIEGQPRRSCTTKLADLLDSGQVITTIEGLARGEQLHPMQQAFLDAGAVQCGFCTPGLVLAASALLQHTPHPSDALIRQRLNPLLCRCTGYDAIVEAVQRGAAGRAPVSPPHSAQAVAKVTGALRFAVDRCPEGALHGVVLRSPHPHAEVVSIEALNALALPGVCALLGPEDVPGTTTYGNARADMPVFAREVRYVGDAVALVVAESEALARQAAALVEVRYRVLPACTDPSQALSPQAPLVHPAGNLVDAQTLRRGDALAALAGAEVVVEGRYSTPFVEHACLETESAVAWREGDTLFVEAPSQNVYFDRLQIARITGWDKRKVVIRQQPMGAAFGKREDLGCQHHAALAALHCGRPVRVAMDRAETFIATTKRHPFVMHYRLGARRDGTFVALQAELLADTGAYASWAPNILRKALVHGAGAYQIEHLLLEARAVYTHNGYAGAFRGFGAPQVHFAVESAVDALARALDHHPVALRRHNGLRVGRVTATGQRLTASVGLPACLDAVAERLDWSHRGPAGPWLRGVGIAQGFYGIGYGNGIPDIGSAVLRLNADGRVQLRISTVDYGQGSSATFQRLLCRALGLDPGQIELITGDTSLCPDSGSTVASRQTYISGRAVLAAAHRFEARLRQAAGQASGPLPLVALAAQGDFRTQARARASSTPLDAQGQGDPYWPYAFGVQGAQVSVDPRSGRVRLDRLIAAQDVGHAIDRLAVEGQIRGAVAMGVGFALHEQYRVVDGMPLDRNFDTYHLPRFSDLPPIEVVIIEDPVPDGPFGAKGVGEPPIVPTAPAIANAVADAIGAPVRELPLTRARVLAAMGR